MSEDCLYLNVWSAAKTPDEKQPVMVWVHGGALVMGSGGERSGVKLTEKGIVLVTINYRLGPFGFFPHRLLSQESTVDASGNQGFRDQIAALKWVRENIEKFGGDPMDVTIFGESAGAWSMSVLQASPLADGLFHKIIGQSGARMLPLARLREGTDYSISGEAAGQALSEKFTAKENPSLDEMRRLPAERILATYESDPAVLLNFDDLTIVDGDVLPE